MSTTDQNTPPAEPNSAAPAAGTPSGDAAAAQPPADADAGSGQPAATPAGGDILDKGADDGAQQETAGDVLAAADDPKPEGVPDSYTFDPPEGFTPNQEALDAAMAVAKEAGLTQDQFDAVAKFDIERTQAANEQAVEDWNTRVNGWRDAAKADKEFGGPDYDANVTTALGAVEKFGDAEFKALLKSPSADNPEGLAIGNHPAVLRFLNRIGKMLGDPSLVQGDDAASAADANEVRLKRLYPSMFKESA